MNRITVTLIGGHNSGRRVEIDPKYLEIKSGTMQETAAPSTADPDPVPIFTDSEVHKARLFVCEGKLVRLYVLEEMSDTEAIQHLVDHYRP